MILRSLCFRKEISENQKLLNNSTFEVTSDKLTKTTHTQIILENEEHKLDYINKYKSNIGEAQASLIVII